MNYNAVTFNQSTGMDKKRSSGRVSYGVEMTRLGWAADLECRFHGGYQGKSGRAADIGKPTLTAPAGL
jgi:hypothetical protein